MKKYSVLATDNGVFSADPYVLPFGKGRQLLDVYVASCAAHVLKPVHMLTSCQPDDALPKCHKRIATTELSDMAENKRESPMAVIGKRRAFCCWERGGTNQHASDRVIYR